MAYTNEDSSRQSTATTAAASSAKPAPPPPQPEQQQPSPLFRVTQDEMLVHQLLLQTGNLLGAGSPLEPSPVLGSSSTSSGNGCQVVDPVAAVSDIAKRAFWDLLQESLASSPPGWGPLLVVLGELRERLLDVVPAGRQRSMAVRSALKEKLDEEYMAHRLAIAPDLPYLRQLFDWLAHMVMQLEAPARAEDTAKRYKEVSRQLDEVAQRAAQQAHEDKEAAAWRVSLHLKPCADGSAGASVSLHPVQPPLPAGAAAAVVSALRLVCGKVDEVRADVARYRLQMLRGLLRSDSNGVEYERRRYEEQVEAAGSVAAAMPVTALWISGARHDLQRRMPEQVPDVAVPNKATVDRVVRHGLLQLIQRPASLVTPTSLGLPALPETLALDAPRMVGFQNELQRLSLVAAVSLVATQVAAAARNQQIGCAGRSSGPAYGGGGGSLIGSPPRSPSPTSSTSSLSRASTPASSPLRGAASPAAGSQVPVADAPGSSSAGCLAAEVQSRFLVLLADPGVQLDTCVEEVAHMVGQQLQLPPASSRPSSPSQQPTSSATAGLAPPSPHEVVAGLARAMLHKVFSTSDPVYQRVQAGIVRGLLAYLQAAEEVHMDEEAAAAAASRLSGAAAGVVRHREAAIRGAVAAALRPVGAETLAGELCGWGADVRRVLSLNLAVCRPYYTQLLGATRRED